MSKIRHYPCKSLLELTPRSKGRPRNGIQREVVLAAQVRTSPLAYSADVGPGGDEELGRDRFRI